MKSKLQITFSAILFLSVILTFKALAVEKPEIFVQMGHSTIISTVAFSPDGRFAISGSWDTLKLWDVKTGREIRTFIGHTDEIN